MDSSLVYEIALFLQIALGFVALCTMRRKRAIEIYPYLACLLGVQIFTCSTSVALLFFHSELHLTQNEGYWALFIVSWLSEGIGLILHILIVYGIFAEAMRPMAGLHAAGKIIFRWVTVVSALVAIALLSGPGVFSGVTAWLNVVSHLDQGVSVLTLCLLVFVCFTIRPLGLTFRSHLFGVSLGLGIASTVELMEAAWLVTSGAKSLYSPLFTFSSVGTSVAFLVWAGYFAAPEPPRRMILLPTTSPFFFWNRISEILGDAPGQVAVAGFTPSMLAPAEIDMLTAPNADEPPPTIEAEEDLKLPAPAPVPVSKPAPKNDAAVLSSLGKTWYSTSVS